MDSKDAPVGSPFNQLLSSPERVAILDILLNYHLQPVQVSYITGKTDINESTVRNELSVLCDSGLVEKTNDDMFKTTDSEKTGQLNSFHSSCHDESRDEVVRQSDPKYTLTN